MLSAVNKQYSILLGALSLEPILFFRCECQIAPFSTQSGSIVSALIRCSGSFLQNTTRTVTDGSLLNVAL